MLCLTCDGYLYEGTRFNALKEARRGEDCQGIPIVRFHVRCTRCSAEVTIRTDPEAFGYVCEKGAKRSRWGSPAEATGAQRRDRPAKKAGQGEEEDPKRDAVAELETKTAEARREMSLADALDEIRMRNSRIERLGSGSDHRSIAATLEHHEKAKIDREGAGTTRRAIAAMERHRAMEEADGMTIHPPPPPPHLYFLSKGASKTKPVLKGIRKKGISGGQGRGSSIKPQVSRDEPKRSLVDYRSDED